VKFYQGNQNDWEVDISSGFHYNGCTVYTDWVSCNLEYNKLGATDWNWCGAWNNGGGNGYGHLDFGANLTLHDSGWGRDRTYGHWNRLSVAPTGHWFNLRGQ